MLGVGLENSELNFLHFHEFNFLTAPNLAVACPEALCGHTSPSQKPLLNSFNLTFEEEKGLAQIS